MVLLSVAVCEEGEDNDDEDVVVVVVVDAIALVSGMRR